MTPVQEIQQLKLELKKLQKQYDNKPFITEGTILFINPKMDKSTTAGKNFFVRELCVEVDDSVNGTEYKRNVGMQLTGNACDLVETLGLAPGDTIECYFTPKGNIKDSEKMVQDPENPGQRYPLNPESKTCFTNLNVYKIVPVFVANPPAEKGSDTNTNASSGGNENTNTNANQAGSGSTKIPQPEGEPPLGENKKPMLWDEVKGAWYEDDLPF